MFHFALILGTLLLESELWEHVAQNGAFSIWIYLSVNNNSRLLPRENFMEPTRPKAEKLGANV